MAKGTYTVGDGAAVRDASYKSCVCALLIFIAICIIILLAGTKWAKDEIDKEVDDEVKRLQLEGSHETTTLQWYPKPTTIYHALTTTSNIRTTTKTTTTPFSTTITIFRPPPTTTTTATTSVPSTATTTTSPFPRSTTATTTTLFPPTTTTSTSPFPRSTTTTTTTPFPPTTTTSTSPFPRSTTTTTTTPFPPTTTTSTSPFPLSTTTTATTSFPPTTTATTSPFTHTTTTTTTTPFSLAAITTTTTSFPPTTTTTTTTTPFAPDTTTTLFPPATTTTTTTAFPRTTTILPRYTTTPNETENEHQSSVYKLVPVFTTTQASVHNGSSYEDLGKDITTMILPLDTASKSSETSEGNYYIISNVTSTEEVTSSNTHIDPFANNETVFNRTPLNNISEAASTKLFAYNVSDQTFAKISNRTTLETSTGSTIVEDNASDQYLLLRKLTPASTVKERSETSTDSAATLRTEEKIHNSTEKEYTSGVTEITDLILIQRIAGSSTTLATILRPITPATTTAKADEGQAFIDNYDDFSESNETVEIVTVVNKRTTQKDVIIDEMQPQHERMNTTTEIHPVLRSSEPVCFSVECKSASSRMLSLMNHSVDPCEDFYEFACGGMEADNADSDTWQKLSEQLHLINTTAPAYLQTFKIFYDSCVSHEYSFDYQDRISKVLELVKEVGQVYDGEPSNDIFDMTDLFAKLILRRSLPIMDVDVDIDKQSLKFIMKLTLPKKTSILKERGRWSALSEGQKRCLDEQRHELHKRNLDLTKIHNSYLECQKNYATYLNSVETVVRALGFYSHLNDTYNQTQSMLGLRTTIEWDILEYLNELSPPNEIRKTILFKQYIVEKISDLQVHYPFLQWKRLFKILTGHEVEDSTLVQVYFRDYFTQLFQGLQQTPYWKINNGLIAMYGQDLYENLVIPQARQNRESYCIKLSSKLFHDISSNLYMKTWPKTDMENSQKFLAKIFNVLKDNLKTVLQKVDWLDDDSKVLMVTKANSISLTFNKEEDLYNDESYLNLRYNNVELKPGDFQYNAIKMLETGRNMLYAIHGKPFSINYLWNYFLNSYDKSPTSFYSKALIMAPLGMVKQPVKGFPGYITMARIGLSLAREIGRHFDPVGIKYGVTLSSESKPSYEGLQSIMENDALFNVERFVGQQEVKFKIDSELSVNERIADNTGLRLISDVFNRSDFLLPWLSSSFSREKIFYITVAQEYCKNTDMSEYMQQLFESEVLPAPLRVENIVTNSDDFSETFECREGSAMNNNPIKTQFPYLEKIEDYNDELENIS